MDAEPRSRTEICAEIAELAQEPGFVYSLAMLLARDLFYDPAEAADIDWSARLSYQEFTFLAGLLVRESISLDHPTEEDVEAHMKRCDDLFEELHASFGAVFFERLQAIMAAGPGSSDTATQESREFFGDGEMMIEPIVYGGSGAYDFQYVELVRRRYARDNAWLVEHKGFTADVMATIADALKDAAAVTKAPTSFDELLDETLNVFCFRADQLPADAPERDAFISAFSLQPGTVNGDLTTPTEYNAVASRPLIVLGDGCYFMPVHFNLAQSVYESPFYWMAADQAYADVSFAHRGLATEEITVELLVPVFGAENVFTGVEFRSGDRVLGEIDVLAIVGDRAVIVQCKSKRLTVLARSGDTEKLREDFAAAVQTAYDQGLECRQLLLEHQVAVVTADGTTLDLPHVKDAYLACVLSDHYPALAHQVDNYLDKDDMDPYPVVVSLFDLDLMAFYLADPFEFAYYLRQRSDLADYYKTDEEAALLALHLSQKLFRTPGFDRATVPGDVAQLIDANFPVAKGRVRRTDAADRLFATWKNEDLERLLNDLKLAANPGFTEAIFFLYDVAGDGADTLIEALRNTKRQTASDGRKHSLATLIGGVGVSYVTDASSPAKLEHDAVFYAQLKKHEARADSWLCLASTGTSPRLVDFVAFNNSPWEPDAELDAAVRDLLGHGTLKRLDKQGRNELCACGSGLKYKKCHGR